MGNSNFDVNHSSSFEEAVINPINSFGGTSGFDLATNHNGNVNVDTFDLDDVFEQRFAIPGFDELANRMGELLDKKDDLLVLYENAVDDNQRSAIQKSIDLLNDEISSVIDKLTIYQNLQDVSDRADDLEETINKLQSQSMSIREKANETFGAAQSAMINECNRIEGTIKEYKKDLLRLNNIKDILSTIVDYNSKMVSLKTQKSELEKQLANPVAGLPITELEHKLSYINQEISNLENYKRKYDILQNAGSIRYIVQNNSESYDAETLKSLKLSVDIYEEMAFSLKTGQSYSELIEEKCLNYLNQDNSRALIFYLMLNETLSEEIQNSTDNELLIQKYNNYFDIETIYNLYNDTKIKLHNEEITEIEANREFSKLEGIANLMGFDLAGAYQAYLDYEAEQRRLESQRIKAQVAAQKKREEEDKNPFVFLWHAYENTELYKNAFALGGKFAQQDAQASKDESFFDFLGRKGSQFLEFNNAYISTLGQVAVQAGIGILKAGEGVVDFAAFATSGLVEAVLLPVDGINWAFGGNSHITQDYINMVSGTIETNWTGKLEDVYYKTESGKILDNDALFTHTSEDAQFIQSFSGALFNILAGAGIGSALSIEAKTAMIAVSGMKGFGMATEKALQDGASVTEAGLYGVASGEWEMFQWALGAEINTLAAKGFEASGTNLAKMFATLTLSTMADSADSAIEGFTQPLLEMIYKDGSYEQLFEECGGWNNVYGQAVLGGLLSVITSTGDAVSSYKNAAMSSEQIKLLDKIEKDLPDGPLKKYVVDLKGNKVEPNTQKLKLSLNEQLKSMGKKTVGALGQGASLLATAVAFSTNPLFVLPVLPFIVKNTKLIINSNNSIKDSNFVIWKNYESSKNPFGVTDYISQDVSFKKTLPLMMMEDKKGVFAIEAMNLFSQLPKTRDGVDITYSMHSQPQTRRLIRELKRQKYITDLVVVDGGTSKLVGEKLMFGNVGSIGDDVQMYYMSFKLTDKAFSAAAASDFIQMYNIDLSDYKTKTIKSNGKDVNVYVPDNKKLFLEASKETLNKVIKIFNKEAY